MLNAGAIALISLLAIGYLAMIAGAERSASRVGSGESTARRRAEVIPPLGPAPAVAAKAPVVVSTHRVYGGGARPAL